MRGSRLAAVLVAVALAAACVRAGFWQLSRLEEKRALNRRQREALAAPAEALGGDARIDSRVGRRVLVAGAYDSLRHVVLRGRGYGGAPGVELLTPLRRPGTPQAFLVERGWLPAADAATAHPDELNEPGVVRVLGVVEVVAPGRGPVRLRVTSVRGATLLTLSRLSIDSVRAWFPYPIAPVVVRALPDSGARPYPVRRPPQPYNESMHLSYAIQWFFFAAALLLGAVFILRSPDPRR